MLCNPELHRHKRPIPTSVYTPDPGELQRRSSQGAWTCQECLHRPWAQASQDGQAGPGETKIPMAPIRRAASTHLVGRGWAGLACWHRGHWAVVVQGRLMAGSGKGCCGSGGRAVGGTEPTDRPGCREHTEPR